MPRLLVLDPHPQAAVPWRHAVLALGCPADVTHDRDTVMSWLLHADREGQLGLLLIVDTCPMWQAHDVVRELRRLPLSRQVPVLVMRQPGEDGLEPDGLYPANATVALDAPPAELMLALALLLGRPGASLYRLGRFLPEGRPWRSFEAFQTELQARLLHLWQTQQINLTQPGLSAGATAGMRHALEYLLANRHDEFALPAARALQPLPGGSRPLAHWAARFAPPGRPGATLSAPSPSAPTRNAPHESLALPLRQRVLLLRVGAFEIGIATDHVGRADWWDPARRTATGKVAGPSELQAERPAMPPDDTADSSDSADTAPGPSALAPRAQPSPRSPKAAGGAQPVHRVTLRGPVTVAELLGEPNTAAAGLWLEVFRQDGVPVLAPVDDVVAYATVSWRAHAPWLRILTGLLGDALRPDGQAVLLLDLAQRLKQSAPPVQPRAA